MLKRTYWKGLFYMIFYLFRVIQVLHCQKTTKTQPQGYIYKLSSLIYQDETVKAFSPQVLNGK